MAQRGAEPAGAKPQTILVVDDDDTLRELLADMLQREGFAVVQARNGELGVAAALNHHPDLVVSDIVMPELDGWEFCQTLRSLPSTRATPFLFLTSLDKTPERILALRLGADDYLTKPFTVSVLLEKVRRLMGRVGHREKVLKGEEAEFSGDKLENILIDTVEFLRTTRRTGVISVNEGSTKGLIYMERGVLKHAILGRTRGEDALLAMLRIQGSQVAFKEGNYPNLPANVKVPWEDFMASLLDRGGKKPR